jgi:hypothetical protein
VKLVETILNSTTVILLSSQAGWIALADYAKKFSGKYADRIIEGGIGHNLPQEAPQDFAKAVVDVDGC